MDRTIVVSNQLSRKRGVIKTLRRNVNDVNKLNKWHDRLFWSHITIGVNEVLTNAKTQ